MMEKLKIIVKVNIYQVELKSKSGMTYAFIDFLALSALL